MLNNITPREQKLIIGAGIALIVFVLYLGIDTIMSNYYALIVK